MDKTAINEADDALDSSKARPIPIKRNNRHETGFRGDFRASELDKLTRNVTKGYHKQVKSFDKGAMDVSAVADGVRIGLGAEDTDTVLRAAAAGVRLLDVQTRILEAADKHSRPTTQIPTIGASATTQDVVRLIHERIITVNQPAPEANTPIDNDLGDSGNAT